MLEREQETERGIEKDRKVEKNVSRVMHRHADVSDEREHKTTRKKYVIVY